MIRLCRTSQISIPDNRIRRKITSESLEELCEDIAKNGLYHPPVLRGDLEKEFILVAGERRFRAIQHLQSEGKDFLCDGLTISASKDLCPFVLVKDVSMADAVEIELQENLLRTDLGWREITDARNRLHELRTAEAEATDQEWNVKKTAEELAKTSGIHEKAAERAISRATVLAPHINDSKLKNVKSEAEAYRIILRQIEGEFSQELIKRGVDEVAASHKLFYKDFREVVIPTNHFDLILTDPPYGIGADTFGSATKTRHMYEDTPEYAKEIMENIIDGGFKWTKDEAHLFMFLDVDMFCAMRDFATEQGWKAYRTPLIWHHSTMGNIPWGVNNIRREYDMILYARKGNKPLIRTWPDILAFSKERNTDHAQAARKPVALIQHLISLSCLPGSTVIDPCCGSGSIFPAASNCGVVAWGMEIEEWSYNIAAAELANNDGNNG